MVTIAGNRGRGGSGAVPKLSALAGGGGGGKKLFQPLYRGASR